VPLTQGPPVYPYPAPDGGANSGLVSPLKINPPPATPPYKPPYRPPYGGGQKGKDWKPKDERPSLVTMTTAYSKDLVTAIIGNNDDLKLRDPDGVIKWATEQTLKLSKTLLDYTLAELTAMGVKLEVEK